MISIHRWRHRPTWGLRTVSIFDSVSGYTVRCICWESSRIYFLRCYATRGNAAATTSSALGCELSQLLQILRSLLRRPRSQY
jgi:hypothetical protein